jgi:hypothetical protein
VGEADNDALALPNSETEAPRTDIEDKEKQRKIALQELRTLTQRKPTLDSAREDRLKAKVALKLDYLPTYVVLFFRGTLSSFKRCHW